MTDNPTDSAEPAYATWNRPQKWRLSLDEDEHASIGRYLRVSPSLSSRAQDDRNYIANEQIVEAINTTLALGKPLLVSGAPGAGKTRLAYWAARRLGLFEASGQPEVFRYDVRSTTKGEDLLYHYDAIGHFRDANLPKGEGRSSRHTRDFIELSALGRGIALAALRSIPSTNTELTHFLNTSFPTGTEPRMSVVLIDEIDKAPRDVPNDLLRALDEMEFTIPELGSDAIVSAQKVSRPLVIATTNNERTLSDAFLRRCCFLHIEFPEVDQIRKIVSAQLQEGWSDSSLAGDAIRLVLDLRKESVRVRKKPGVAELLDFLLELRSRGAHPDSRLATLSYAETVATAIFAKDKLDHHEIGRVLSSHAQLTIR